MVIIFNNTRIYLRIYNSILLFIIYFKLEKNFELELKFKPQ
jgi:hypothetical protein